jgi:hypothetical protein
MLFLRGNVTPHPAPKQEDTSYWPSTTVYSAFYSRRNNSKVKKAAFQRKRWLGNAENMWGNLKESDLLEDLGTDGWILTP